MTELQIVNGVKNGDRKAMRAMYDLLAGSAMATAVRYLGDSDDCRDVLQDCFLKAFTRIDDFSYRDQGSLRAWMTRIVANESINSLKRHARLTFLDEVNVEAPEEEPPDINVVPLEEINRMIAELPTGYPWCSTNLCLSTKVTKKSPKCWASRKIPRLPNCCEPSDCWPR